MYRHQSLVEYCACGDLGKIVGQEDGYECSPDNILADVAAANLAAPSPIALAVAQPRWLP